MTQRAVLMMVGGLMLFAGGCASPGGEAVAPRSSKVESGVSPAARRLAENLARSPVVEAVGPWDAAAASGAADVVGLRITTPHYTIYSTLTDVLLLRQAPVFLENAYQAYCAAIGRQLATEAPLTVYLFEERAHWEHFTRQWAGPQAPLYLRIRRGAYYLNGAMVAYHLGRTANFSVLAHEGWHQFAERHFVLRLPSWVDEGLATSFEAYRWEQGRPVFAPRGNGGRLLALQEALAEGRLFPLRELLQRDPGGVLSAAWLTDESQADPRVAAYYAQVYALVRFLREYDYGRFLGDLRRLLRDGQAGAWPLPADLRVEATQRDRNPTRLWNARVGRLLFESYITPDVAAFETAFVDYCRHIARTVQPRR